MSAQDSSEEFDCTEGCSGDHKHKWEITPNPYSDEFDTYVTDHDGEASAAIVAAAELVWDECEPGQERSVTIRHNKVAGDE